LTITDLKKKFRKLNKNKYKIYWIHKRKNMKRWSSDLILCVGFVAIKDGN